MFILRKQIDTSGTHCRYSMVLLWVLEISIQYHVLKGDHLELNIGIGPIDISFGTTIWRHWIRA